MADKPGQNFQVHVTKKSKLGAHVSSVLVILLFVGAGLWSYQFASNDEQLVEHIKARDDLVYPALLVYRVRTVPDAALRPMRDVLGEAGDSDLREAAARALGKAKNSGSTADLGAALTTDESPKVRVAAALALADNGDKNCRLYIKQGLEDDYEGVKIATCHAVGELALDEFIPQLIDLLKHHSGDVQRAALENLDKFLPEGTTSFGFNVEKWTDWWVGQ